MKWHKEEAGWYFSEQEDYAVNRICNHSWEAVVFDGAYAKLIGIYSTMKEARAACEKEQG